MTAPSILFATPMYGGQCTLAYWASTIKLEGALSDGGVAHDWWTGQNESLVQRARNEAAAFFLRDPQFSHLFFIDADIEFTPEDVAAIWNMDVDIAVGAYPLKKVGGLFGAWLDYPGRLVPLDSLDGQTDVAVAGTGFMLISRQVFERMKTLPGLEYAGQGGRTWAFFDTEVSNDIYWSEDYLFCRRWRELGGRIILDPSIRLKHHGSFAYDGEQACASIHHPSLTSASARTSRL